MSPRKKRIRELTINEVADKLSTTAYQVFQLINSKKLKAHRFGGHYRVTPEQLQEYLENRLKEGGRSGDIQ